MTAVRHHQVVIVGGGTAGISVAPRLRRQGVTDIALVEPSEHHHYQPLRTLVGSGLAKAGETVRPQGQAHPPGRHLDQGPGQPASTRTTGP